ncbi:type III secretion apparatus assembly protein SctX [Rhizobium alvei]|uniref:Uncharacterized protein n=1 Tax=Rhizobium alvei TaxID=1132659 RepID=A0ABT8YSY2_9HYPH|nr:hypothetical protein [Rhizobium alvei]MDO6966443.1 hypothetical protein [Rhizobium alvei]
MKATRPTDGSARSFRIQSLDVGVESIGRWRIDDEQHLPEDRKPSPVFLPEARALDEILRRPSLDERLPNLLRPDRIDPDLLLPARMSAVRLDVAQRFREMERHAKTQASRNIFALAATVMEDDAALDDEVQSALALLLRG